METKQLNIQLQAEDWAFVASEVERLKVESEDVTQDAVVSTLAETGIEQELGGGVIAPAEMSLLKMLRVRTGNDPRRLFDALVGVGQQISNSPAGADVIRRRLAGICSHCDLPVVAGDVTCAEHAL